MRDASRYVVWTDIENLFHDNKNSHAIFLEAEFHCIVQCDMTISDDCYRLKTLADTLGDLCHFISNEILVLTMLRGLNDEYSMIATLLPMQTTFPSFIQACSLILLKETC